MARAKWDFLEKDYGVNPTALRQVRPRLDTGQMARWHASPSTLRRVFKHAATKAKIYKHVGLHTLRHSFAVGNAPSVNKQPYPKFARFKDDFRRPFLRFYTASAESGPRSAALLVP